MELRRQRPFGRRQVAVARRQGESVGFAQGRHASDLHRNVEVAHGAGDDPELLIILLAEQGDVGSDLVDELGDHGRDPGEMPGPVFPTQPLREARYLDPGREAGRVHGLDVRQVGGIHPRFRQESEVRLDVARIPREVLRWAELGRVHEDADHHPPT